MLRLALLTSMNRLAHEEEVARRREDNCLLSGRLETRSKSEVQGIDALQSVVSIYLEKIDTESLGIAASIC